MAEEFRIYVHDDASRFPEAVAWWKFDTEEPALEYAKELCKAFQKRKDCLKNLNRFSVRVYKFYGYKLGYRLDIFDSKEMYPCET